MSAATFELPSPPGTVLIVEDDVLMRHMLADCLRECGHRVIEASNAMEAFEVLIDAPVDLCVVGHLQGKPDRSLPTIQQVKATLAKVSRPARQPSPTS